IFTTQQQGGGSDRHPEHLMIGGVVMLIGIHRPTPRSAPVMSHKPAFEPRGRILMILGSRPAHEDQRQARMVGRLPIIGKLADFYLGGGLHCEMELNLADRSDCNSRRDVAKCSAGAGIPTSSVEPKRRPFLE